MNAIKEARRFIEKDPTVGDAQILARLILALQAETEFSISDLYQLSLARFQLALEIMQEWRIDRFYIGKAKLFDIAVQATELGSTPMGRQNRG